jgi:hypothetical protein
MLRQHWRSKILLTEAVKDFQRSQTVVSNREQTFLDPEALLEDAKKEPNAKTSSPKATNHRVTNLRRNWVSIASEKR